MRKTTLILPTIAVLSLLISACGQPSGRKLSAEQFQGGMEASIKAAEKGKELMKNARPKR
jgi:hypothetical protein